MGQVIVRNLDDSVLLRLKQMAQRDSKSLEQFLRDQLSETAMRDREGFFEFARGMRERCKPIDIDPTDLIREDRDR